MKWHHLLAGILALMAAQAQAEGDKPETSPGEQAQDKGITTCLSTIERLAKYVADENPHYSVATWNTVSPNTHLFNSQVVVKYSDGYSVAVLNAAPAGKDRCDGTYTSITATAATCQEARETTFKGWKFYSKESGLTMLENESGSATIVMLPDDKGGCVTIRTEVAYR